VFKLDFLIIGAQKSGTTSLRSFLEQYEKDIFIVKRELHFWNRDGQYRDGLGIEQYADSFHQAGEKQITGEKSPSYLPSSSAPERIASHFPQIKLIAILRNPIDRAYSAYWHGRRVGAISTSQSFGEVIRSSEASQGKPYGDLITQGLYSRHIGRYLEFFPRAQMHFMEFDQLRQNSDLHLRSTLDFLGVAKNALGSGSKLALPLQNTARTPRFEAFTKWVHQSKRLNPAQKSRLIKKNLKSFEVPPMLGIDREFLLQRYAQEPSELGSLTGLKVDWFR
jgi:hypothetical protein